MFTNNTSPTVADVRKALNDMGYTVETSSFDSGIIRKNGTIVGDMTVTRDMMTMEKSIVVHMGENAYHITSNADLDAFKAEYAPKNIQPANDGETAGEETITVQYRAEDTTRISIQEKGDWIDLYADETVELKKGEHKLVHLGVAMKLPEGYEAHLVPRSSTYKKWGIIQANHVGIIDNSYCGPEDWWKMSVIAMRDTMIERGDKICQFRIVKKQPTIKFVEGKMTDPSRGGFGSTGTK